MKPAKIKNVPYKRTAFLTILKQTPIIVTKNQFAIQEALTPVSGTISGRYSQTIGPNDAPKEKQSKNYEIIIKKEFTN